MVKLRPTLQTKLWLGPWPGKRTHQDTDSVNVWPPAGPPWRPVSRLFCDVMVLIFVVSGVHSDYRTYTMSSADVV